MSKMVLVASAVQIWDLLDPITVGWLRLNDAKDRLYYGAGLDITGDGRKVVLMKMAGVSPDRGDRVILCVGNKRGKVHLTLPDGTVHPAFRGGGKFRFKVPARNSTASLKLNNGKSWDIHAA